MRKTNVIISHLAMSVCESTIARATLADRGIEIVTLEDLQKPEPIMFTNPYPVDMLKPFCMPETKTRKGGNNRKKIKRKKAKNGRNK
jgi:hypothetical protein